ncbi:MAG: M14 family zinc carboxypeptidase [Phycisphaerae bacterium]|nr:M14 family zinc carboxypeptidase [Phycisphaerae bacterium]
MDKQTLKIVIILISIVLSTGFAQTDKATNRVDHMTYAQAKARIPDHPLPDFWIGDVKGLASRFEHLEQGRLTVLATTPGGRPIYMVTYGDRETVAHKANFNSAIGGQDPAAYMDKAARKKPVILFLGPVHGHEVEGLTGLVNLVQIMETGKDLRGKSQEKLRQLGGQCRLLILPAGNPDGTARFEPRSLTGMGDDDLRFWGQGTWTDDTFCDWPQCKRQHPMVGDNVRFLGCYFNDRGINPMHDEFFAPMGPESAALLKVAREEGPDLAVSLHSHESKPAALRPAYVTTEIQQDIRSLAKECYALLSERQLPFGGLFEVRPEGGKNPDSFNLTSALYHVCGAGSFTFECPHGIRGNCEVTLDQILDIQLSLYEAMLQHEIGKKH